MDPASTLVEVLRATAPPGLTSVALVDSSQSAFDFAKSFMADLGLPVITVTPPTTIEDLVERAAGAKSAFIVEPVMTGPALIPLAPGFLAKLREMCDDTGGMLVADERRVGAGRTGFVWACARDGISPDLLIAGSNLTAGEYEIGAVLSRHELPQASRFPSLEATVAAAGWMSSLDDASLGEVRRRAARMTDLLGDLASGPGVVRAQARGLLGVVEFDDGEVAVIEPALHASDGEIEALVRRLRART